ncbi:MAG: hypothetical protein NT113_14100 [Hyphomicrobiales bacterium]|nr:hypothetical protein [Hyphomicrobiales bacterium]
MVFIEVVFIEAFIMAALLVAAGDSLAWKPAVVNMEETPRSSVHSRMIDHADGIRACLRHHRVANSLRGPNRLGLA